MYSYIYKLNKEGITLKDIKEIEIQWVDIFGNPIKKETYDLTDKTKDTTTPTRKV